MAMSARSGTITLLLLLALCRPACAASDPYAGILNGPATRAEVNEANRLWADAGPKNARPYATWRGHS